MAGCTWDIHDRNPPTANSLPSGFTGHLSIEYCNVAYVGVLPASVHGPGFCGAWSIVLTSALQDHDHDDHDHQDQDSDKVIMLHNISTCS